ncbi:MAG: single-stranded DNA-binding protein [Clostridia bacterium]|nr:single-stranded DNA-binding protein [Clostridia bacterium]
MNKVFFIGNLTRDPEVSVINSGVQVCRFAVAENYRPYNNNTETNREANFFNVVAWRNLAELCGKYLRKGNKVAIIGTIQMRTYEQNGERRTIVEVVADNVEFLTPKNAAEGSAEYSAPAPAPDKVVGLEPVDETDLPF